MSFSECSVLAPFAYVNEAECMIFERAEREAAGHHWLLHVKLLASFETIRQDREALPSLLTCLAPFMIG